MHNIVSPEGYMLFSRMSTSDKNSLIIRCMNYIISTVNKYLLE